MSAPDRVLHVLGAGGQGRTRTLATWLPRTLGQHGVVVTPDQVGARWLAEAGLEVAPVPVGRWLLGGVALAPVVRAARPDVVVIHDPGVERVVRRAAAEVPCVALRWGEGPVDVALDAWIATDPSVGDALARACAPAGRVAQVVAPVPPGRIDPAGAAEVRRAARLGPRALVVGVVRPDRVVVEALARLGRPDVRGIQWGEARDRGGRARIPRVAPDARVSAFLGAVVGVVDTGGSGWGARVALAAGIPVVAPDIPPFSGLLGAGRGRVVADWRPGPVALALSELVLRRRTSLDGASRGQRWLADHASPTVQGRALAETLAWAISV